MTDQTPGSTPPDRQPARDFREAVTTTEIAALAVSVLWLVALAVGFFTRDSGGGLAGALRLVLVTAGVFMPLVTIWLTAIAVRSVLALRDEVTRLQTVADSLRKSQTSRAHGASTMQAGGGPRPAASPAQRPATPRAAPAAASARAEPAAAAPEPDASTGPDRAVTPADFVRALDFPATAEDREGFRALKRAREDRRAAELIQASQDVLTLLSEHGIYMDDLSPDPAPAEAWRRFARGTEGRSIAQIGPVGDAELVEQVAGRMQRDTIFRDTAHHFLRRFDQIVAEFEPHATDAEMAALGDTRTARAFLLVAQASDAFD